ncbi:DUF1648 domain-containing protein [Persicobacter psychrovividus]|uniref:DUF1648 domain-containing protein n=1 Tax=Persicobacter psychrovividus TaxID=387638 RepID=A0ABM7VJV3_9BACT|nr:hypothetical protein PEPS_33820 [Persicobacter psychrovividus]
MTTTSFNKFAYRPRITINLDWTDYIVLTFILSAFIFLATYPVMYYDQLPQQIPIHYGLDGLPDRYGSKVDIFLLPIIAWITCFSLYFLNKFPHLFNYPVKITKRNARRQYRMSTKMLRHLNALLLLLFSVMVYWEVEIARGNRQGFNNYIFFGLMLALTVLIGYYVYQGRQQKD